MAKPVPPTELHSELYGRVSKSKKYQEEPALSNIDDRLHYFKMSKKAAEGVKDRYQFVLDNKLTREMVPTEWLNDPKVFMAFLDGGMPLTAMIRSLGPMTSYGVFTDQEYVTKVCNVLNNAIMLKQARVHPMAILLAMTTYKSGRGFRGGLSWQPKTPIIDALDSAFYNSWGNVIPSNKRIMIGLDVSGSMGAPIMNTNITCRDASVAMCMITKATEPQVDCFGFSTTFKPLDLSPRRRLDDNVRTLIHLPFAGTDCSLPMMEALKMKNVYDAFVIYTDNETWAGRIHPVEALAEYRREKNPEAKLVVVGMTSTRFTIADPKDSGMMDVVGFDASAPSVISNFLR
jgi:60 kDa SS-A/Ro ribonucleoprotein